MATATDDELAKARDEAGWPDGAPPPEDADANGNGRTAAERAEAGEGTGEEDDGQLFVLEHGKQVTLSTLYRRGTSVEYRLNLGSKSIKGSGKMGLVSFNDPDILLLVPARAGDVRLSPSYDGDGNLKKVTVYAQMKPQTAYDADTKEAKRLMGIEVEG